VCVFRFPDRTDFNRPAVLDRITASPREKSVLPPPRGGF